MGLSVYGWTSDMTGIVVDVGDDEGVQITAVVTPAGMTDFVQEARKYIGPKPALDGGGDWTVRRIGHSAQSFMCLPGKRQWLWITTFYTPGGGPIRSEVGISRDRALATRRANAAYRNLRSRSRKWRKN